MKSILVNTWSLFLGFSIICLAHGLQGTLLGVRAIYEGFSYIAIGFVISGFFIGYLSGSILIPILLQRVGHIRVFAALASLASIAILLHTLFLDPLSWFFIRILTGVSISGIIVIMESWLNDKSTLETRGRLLSIYMIITFTFIGLGQLLLNIRNHFSEHLQSTTEWPDKFKISKLLYSCDAVCQYVLFLEEHLAETIRILKLAQEGFDERNKIFGLDKYLNH